MNQFQGHAQSNFTRRSSLSDGYYSGLDDRLTMRRLVKGVAYCSIFCLISAAVLFVGAAVGF